MGGIKLMQHKKIFVMTLQWIATFVSKILPGAILLLYYKMYIIYIYFITTLIVGVLHHTNIYI